MSFVTSLLALFVAARVAAKSKSCAAVYPDQWGHSSEKEVTIASSQCWWFCRRYWKKGGECSDDNWHHFNFCWCDKPLTWSSEDYGSCSKETHDGVTSWIPNCQEVCEREGHTMGGECSFTWDSLWTFGKRCMCRVIDEPEKPPCPDDIC